MIRVTKACHKEISIKIALTYFSLLTLYALKYKSNVAVSIMTILY
jgi:hypothetical protein